MTKENAAQFLPLVTALANGKTIQENAYGEWKDMNEVAFIHPPDHYRIKPEPPKPREWTVRVHLDGSIYPVQSNYGTILVREVLNEKEGA